MTTHALRLAALFALLSGCAPSPYVPPAPPPDPFADAPVEGYAAASPIPNLLAPSGWQTRTKAKGDWYAKRQPDPRRVRTIWIDSNGRKIKLADGVTAEQAAFNACYDFSYRSGIVWRLVPKNQAAIRVHFGTPAQLRERSKAYGTLGGGYVSENVAWQPGNPEVWVGTAVKSNHPNKAIRGKPLTSASVTRATGKAILGFWGWRYDEGIVGGNTYLEQNMSHPVRFPPGGCGAWEGRWLERHFGPGWLGRDG